MIDARPEPVLRVLALGVCLAGCEPGEGPVAGAPTPAPTPARGFEAFEEIAEQAGLRSDARTEGYMGVAVGDVDGDGWPDLYLSGLGIAGGGARGRLFLNAGDGTFEDATDAWGAGTVLGPGDNLSGAVFADYDNDGDPDLFLAAQGRDRLLRHDGDRFTEIGADVGLDPAGDSTVAHALADFDGDGRLDLFAINQVFPAPNAPWTEIPDQTPPRLLQGSADGGFVDRSAWLPPTDVPGAGYAAAWVDVDSDGDVDLYTANDHGIPVLRNQLIRNDGPDGDGWALTLASDGCGCAAAIAAMGVTAGDYDRDLVPDLYVTNLAEYGGELLLNGVGDGTFVEAGAATGARIGSMEERPSSWGSEFLDYDNDGWADLFVAFSGAPGGEEGSGPAPNALLRNLGGTFEEVVEAGIDDHTGPTIAATTVDFDLDGCVDVIALDLHGEARLYRNRCEDAGSWIGLRLEGTGSNRDAVGAVVEIDAGGGWQRGEVVAGSSSMASGRWKTLHFGLGEADRVERAVVRWPSGLVESIGPLPAGRIHPVVEGEASANR